MKPVKVKGYEIHSHGLEEHDDGNTTHFHGHVSVKHPNGSVKHFEAHGNDRGTNVRDTVMDHIHNHSGGLSESEYDQGYHAIAGKPVKLKKSEKEMNKLLELEKKLKEAKAELEKIMSSSTTATGSVNSTGGTSIASQIGFGKAEDEDKKKKEDKHDDEKEDKKLIARAIDKHNEDKHGEDKDEDSAQKEMGLKKGLPGNKFGNQAEQDRDSSMHAARKPAISIDPKTGAKTVIEPKDQVKAQADAKAATKAKNEAAAAERRAQMRAEAKPKEVVKFEKNGQWKMDC